MLYMSKNDLLGGASSSHHLHPNTVQDQSSRFRKVAIPVLCARTAAMVSERPALRDLYDWFLHKNRQTKRLSQKLAVNFWCTYNKIRETELLSTFDRHIFYQEPRKFQPIIFNITSTVWIKKRLRNAGWMAAQYREKVYRSRGLSDRTIALAHNA